MQRMIGGKERRKEGRKEGEEHRGEKTEMVKDAMMRYVPFHLAIKDK